MNILIANDDGITSEGIAKLAEIAGRFGDVYIFAPASQRSAASMCITIRDYLEVKKAEFPVKVKEAFSISGTPADCVKVAMNGLLDVKYDLVLSGINDGPNAGTDTLYSGTVGVAMEARTWGVPAMAVSLIGHDYQDVDKYLEGIIRDLLGRECAPNEIWNINFPDAEHLECKGIRETKTAYISDWADSYRIEQISSDEWQVYPGIVKNTQEAKEGTDVRAITDGYISIEKMGIKFIY